MITLETCIREALNTPELLKQYNRLSGASIGKPKAPIEMMIDEATGYGDEEMFKFFTFVRDYVWIPVLQKKDVLRHKTTSPVQCRAVSQ